MTKNETLSLQALRIFRLVAEKRYVKTVAQTLGVTPSAVSQTINRLEEDLGVELFMHDVRPLRLTPAGRILFRGVPPLLIASEALRRQVTDRSLAEMTVRLGMSESVTATLSPWLIGELKRRVRELSATSLLTMPLVESLRDEQLDVAILPDGLLAEDRWERVALYEEDFLLVTPREGTAGSRLISTPADFAELAAARPFIGYSREGSSDQAEVDRILRAFGVRPANVVTVTSSYALTGLVAELGGWGVIPPTNVWCGRQFVEGVAVSPLPGGRRITRTMWAVSDRNLHPGRAALVAEIVREVFEKRMLPELERTSPELARHARLA